MSHLNNNKFFYKKFQLSPPNGKRIYKRLLFFLLPGKRGQNTCSWNGKNAHLSIEKFIIYFLSSLVYQP